MNNDDPKPAEEPTKQSPAEGTPPVASEDIHSDRPCSTDQPQRNQAPTDGSNPSLQEAEVDTSVTDTGVAGPDVSDYSLLHSIHTGDLPLSEYLSNFWSFRGRSEEQPGSGAIPVAPSDEPFDILKRLGPSPFPHSRFPLIGFFASAYERVSRFAGQRSNPD